MTGLCHGGSFNIWYIWLIKVSKVMPDTTLIQWGASKVPSNAKAICDMQLCHCLGGKPTKWRYVGETFKMKFAVGELEPGTKYEVRVRTRVDKMPGAWQIKEHAFTAGVGETSRPSTMLATSIFRSS
ncbi:MAG: fibronectin type III domain-containing protein [Verrucomicrobiota bacterium]|nr:fibronectin type III domain-containing protein [Verrucomicrobiota bacterium]